MAEVERRLNEWDRRISGQVSRELYERDRQDMRDDISEIKTMIKADRESSRMLARIVVAEGLTVVGGILLILLGNP